MRKGYRDVLDPNDSYWPRVRRLHTHLWAKGTVAAKTRHLILFSLLWLLTSILGTLFSLVWRGALIYGALLLIDWARPGVVSCIFRETVGYDVARSALSGCTISGSTNLALISLGALLLMALALIYPIRRFAGRIIEIAFMAANMIALGYPLRFLAHLASHDPTIAGKWFDKSYFLGPVTTAMTDMFPIEVKQDYEDLWYVYNRSQSPAHEPELEDLLKQFEVKYSM